MWTPRSVGNVERILILYMKFWMTLGTDLHSKKGEILNSRICGFSVQHSHQLPINQHSLLAVMRQMKLQRTLGKMTLVRTAWGKSTHLALRRVRLYEMDCMTWLPEIAEACVPRNLDLLVEIKVKNRLRRQGLCNLLKIYLGARCELLCLL